MQASPNIHPPQAIIFDIGRVIIHVNVGRAFAPLAAAWKNAGTGTGHGKPNAEQIWRAIQADPSWQNWQEGRLTAQQWHERITARLGVSLKFEDFCASWNMALDPELILPDTLFEQLGARCRLGLISNTDPLHVDCIERNFRFVRHFSARIYSCQLGATKPTPAIYEEALRQLGVPAAAALYIDDIPAFAEGARQIGMDAICFESKEQLAGDLSRRGLPIALVLPHTAK